MDSAWQDVNRGLPAPGEQVLRYGQSILGPHIDVGELVAKDGARWADWGVTHWRHYEPCVFPPLREPPSFLPDEWLYLARSPDRCTDKRCGHLSAFHVDDGPVDCLIPNCQCRGWQKPA